MSQLTFRNAQESDVSLILEFIKKLADYEKRLDEVIATEEDIRYWLFHIYRKCQPSLGRPFHRS